MDEGEGRTKFLEQVQKGCRIARKLRELGVRPYGVVRFDSATGVGDWAADPAGNQAKIAETFKQAGKIARDHGERLAAEGEICWGGMHSWRKMVDLLERVGEPETVGFQADMAHTLLYTLGENAPEDRILPDHFDWKDRADARRGPPDPDRRPSAPGRSTSTSPRTTRRSSARARTTTPAATAWPPTPTASSTSPTTPASGSATRTGTLTKAFRHICWDGCMFPNAVMMKPQTWNDILGDDDRRPRRPRLEPSDAIAIDRDRDA